MAGTEYADLEITLNRWNADTYRVELRYSQPDSDVDIRLAPGTPALARFDPLQLQMLALDPNAYGTLLGANLFGDVNVKTAFAQARANAQSQDASLRLRLFIDSAAPGAARAALGDTARSTGWCRPSLRQSVFCLRVILRRRTIGVSKSSRRRICARWCLLQILPILPTIRSRLWTRRGSWNEQRAHWAISR